MKIGELEILKGSPYCSLQDSGRNGYLGYGFPASGPLDSVSMRLANYLLGNQEWDSCMELMVSGPKMRFLSECQVAIAGARVECFINGKVQDCLQSIPIKEGDVMSFGKFEDGYVSYLAINGGFRGVMKLGSYSTLSHQNFGNPITNGVRLKYQSGEKALAARDSPNFLIIERPEVLNLRVLKGVDFVDDILIKELYSQIFTISPQSDRMGIRLNAEMPISSLTKEIVSSGVLKGTIQLPPSGNPIIMSADHQTAGGYPRIATVITHDMDYLAQMPPNSKIRFRKVTLEKAVDLLQKREQKIKRLFV